MPRSTASRPPSSTRSRSRNLRLSLIAVALFAVAVAAVIAVSRYNSGTASDAASAPVATSATVRPDSHRLSVAPGSTVTFVEFLDFECEGCRAWYPDVEELRKVYTGRVEFVMRYFPLRGHFNAERAARAVEAAAQQGRLEPMYNLMYQTQPEWGEQQVPMDDRFRGYAQRMGLDMARFDAAYNDPRTLDRIKVDVQDGQDLRVKSTPTFFVNGKKLDPESYDDLTRAIDDALAGR